MDGRGRDGLWDASGLGTGSRSSASYAGHNFPTQHDDASKSAITYTSSRQKITSLFEALVHKGAASAAPTRHLYTSQSAVRCEPAALRNPHL
jgi:hypothetical protein